MQAKVSALHVGIEDCVLLFRERQQVAYNKTYWMQL